MMRMVAGTSSGPWWGQVQVLGGNRRKCWGGIFLDKAAPPEQGVSVCKMQGPEVRMAALVFWALPIGRVMAQSPLKGRFLAG